MSKLYQVTAEIKNRDISTVGSWGIAGNGYGEVVVREDFAAASSFEARTEMVRLLAGLGVYARNIEVAFLFDTTLPLPTS